MIAKQRKKTEKMKNQQNKKEKKQKITTSYLHLSAGFDVVLEELCQFRSPMIQEFFKKKNYK